MTELHAFNVSPRTPHPVVMFDGPAPGNPPAPPSMRAALPPAQAPASASRGHGFRSGVVTLRYALRTPRVRQFYRRDFLALGDMLAGLDRARHFREVEPERVDAAEQAVAHQVRDARAVFAEAAARADALLGAHPLGDIPIRYPEVPPIDAPIAHPQARGYMEALQAADAAYAAVERAWLFGVVDTRERRTLEASFRKAIRSIGNTIRSEYSEMARRLRPPSGPDASAAPAGPAPDPTEPQLPGDGPGRTDGLPRTGSRRPAPRAVPFPGTPGTWVPGDGPDDADIDDGIRAVPLPFPIPHLPAPAPALARPVPLPSFNDANADAETGPASASQRLAAQDMTPCQPAGSTPARQAPGVAAGPADITTHHAPGWTAQDTSELGLAPWWRSG